MRFLSLDCHFGKLHGRYQFDPDRLTLVLDENEQGKTTLVEAIVAALYGYERGARRAGALPERERYLPVDGGDCFVQLDLSANGRQLRIRRVLTGDARDVVRVTDLDTGADATAALAPTKGEATPGETLLGLTREQFLKVCLVRQGEIGELRKASSLREKLEKLVDSDSGQETAGAAVGALDEAMRHYQGVAIKNGNVETEMKQLDERRLNARNEQDELRRRRDAIDADARQLEALDAQDRADADAQARLLYLANRAEQAALAGEQQRAEARAARMDDLRERTGRLQAYRSIPADAQARLEAVRAAIERSQGTLRGAERDERELRLEIDSMDGRLERMGPIGGWRSAQRDEALTWRDRLLTARQAEAAAEAAWREAFRNAGPAAQALFSSGQSPFDALSDGERRTLLHYPEAAAQLRLRIQQLERQPAQQTAPRQGDHDTPLLVLGGVLLVAGLGLLVVRPLLGLAPLLLAAGLLAAGWLRGGSYRVDEAAVAARALAQRDLDEAATRLQRLEEDAALLASRAGAATAGEAAEALEDYLNAQREAAGLRTQHEILSRAADGLTEARERIAGLWRQAGRSLDAAAVTEADADRLLHAIEEALATRHRREDAAKSLELARSARGDLEASLEAHERDWTVRCQELELPEADPAAAIRQIGEKVEGRKRLEHCEAELQLLAGESAGAPAGTVEQRLSELAERLKQAEALDAAFAPLTVTKTAAEYRDEREAVQIRRDAGQRERQRLRDRAGQALDDFRRRMPAAMEAELAAGRRLEQAAQYRDALGLALETLREVAREAHRSWSQTLNRYGDANLRHLAPNYPQLRFDEQLNVRVFDAGGRPWAAADGRLSAGARDRIFLAVRLALAEYCSPPDDPLPLLLDDPFVTSDDERFEGAVRFLLDDVAARHQVILLSCHRGRHERSMERYPDVWNERAVVTNLEARES